MKDIKLKISDLILDDHNPRISHADGQREVLQEIVTDQGRKLLTLARSIAENGLSPTENFLVLRSEDQPSKFIALEGNRRTAVLKLLFNPELISSLSMPSQTKRALETLAQHVKKRTIEPLRCVEMDSRDATRYWLLLRHNGAHDGAGVDNWSSLAKRRFEGGQPELHVLNLVTEQGQLTEAERGSITNKFPTSTLKRLLDSRDVRKRLEIEIKDGSLKLNSDKTLQYLKKLFST